LALLTSHPQRPLPWARLLGSVAALWVAPVALGLAGLMLFIAANRLLDGQGGADIVLGLWFFSYALVLSPVFSWVGWLIALPPVALAVHRGWFGWGAAALIGAAAGSIAGAAVETEIALPFGVLALLALRALLGRVLPL